MMGVKSDKENKLLKALKDDDDIADLLPTTVSRRSKNLNYKPMLLILGHLLENPDVKDPVFADSMRKILKSGVGHINMMIDVGQEINQFARMGATQKKLGVKAFQTLINFQQMFVQGLWEKRDPLLQLPGFDDDEIKKYKRNMKAHQI